jgi:uncharacterized lipoprotein
MHGATIKFKIQNARCNNKKNRQKMFKKKPRLCYVWHLALSLFEENDFGKREHCNACSSTPSIADV